MEEIKVGEYVRYSDGDIQKTQENYIDYFNYVLRNGERLEDGERKIVKHSSNIIDLIEEGDYVNGKYVYSIGTAIGNLPIINHTDGTFTPSNFIKSILTKELYEQNCYKLED